MDMPSDMMLYGGYDDMQPRYGGGGFGGTDDLSTQLLMTEEEKLKISKMLMEMQMENNRLREEYDSLKFELSKRTVHLENELAAMETRCQHEISVNEEMRRQLIEVEEERREMADKYVALKSDLAALQRAHDAELKRCDDLSLELLNVINGKAAWMQKMGQIGNDSEMKRVRDMVNDKPWRNKNNDRTGDSNVITRTFSSDERKFRGDLDKLKSQSNLEQRKLEEKLMRLHEELNNTREAVKERQRKATEAQTQMLAMKTERDEMQLVNNKLEQKIKDIKDDFESRLNRYVRDIAKFMDTMRKTDEEHRDFTPMKDYVNQMLKDLKKAHRLREEQLNEVSLNFKKRLEAVARRHEQLIVAYRMLRESSSQSGLADYDLGPSELGFQLSEPELQSHQQHEINKLRERLEQAQADIEGYKASYPGKDPINIDIPNGASWAVLRKELRDFTSNTQQDLERERAELLSRTALLDAENKQLTDYIDTHLSKYRDEIDRLRRVLAEANIQAGNSGISPVSTPNTWRRDRYRK